MDVAEPLLAEVSRAIDELRSVAMDLRPAFLEEMDLGEALGRHVQQLQAHPGVPIHMQVEGLWTPPRG